MSDKRTEYFLIGEKPVVLGLSFYEYDIEKMLKKNVDDNG